MTREQLMARSPVRPVRSLADLTPTENVWPPPAGYGELYGQLAHRKAGHKLAVCGAVIAEWAMAAEHSEVLGGRLCPQCWTYETSVGNGLAEMEG